MARAPRAQHDLYSPERPTAVVLSGTGVDGAYHAGVLEALHDAGVKIDLVAGRGVGALGAILFALDGASALWDDHGPWRRPARRLAYGLTLPYRALGMALALGAATLLLPLVVLVAAFAVWPVGLVAGWLGVDTTPPLAVSYAAWVGWVLAPEQLPTWVARALVLIGAGLLAGVSARAIAISRRDVRTRRGAFWWRWLGPPVDSERFATAAMRMLWDLLRGGAQQARPKAAELSQRLSELLVSGRGQPGHRDVLVTVHDLDARRDLVLGVIAGDAGRRLFPGTTGPSDRRAETIDVATTGRTALVDALAGCLTVSELSEPHPLLFPADSVWRGEAHRVADRPAALSRLLEEAASSGIEQAIVVTATPDPPGPHALGAPRLDPRGRTGEWLVAQETAAVRDAVRYAQAHFHAVFVIRPAHNPLLPMDLGGAHDHASDRFVHPSELVTRGHDDAHRLFIAPALGAAGERVGETARGRS